VLFARPNQKIIPYDDPFLWVDEIETIEGDFIVGYKNTSLADPYFAGHFVDFPIMPGVLIVEGIAQTATFLLRQKLGPGHEKKHLLAYQVRSAQFLSPILPGDRIKYKVQLLGIYGSKIANFVGEAYVGNALKCEARFSVAIIDKDEMKEKFTAAAISGEAGPKNITYAYLGIENRGFFRKISNHTGRNGSARISAQSGRECSQGRRGWYCRVIGYERSQ